MRRRRSLLRACGGAQGAAAAAGRPSEPPAGVHNLAAAPRLREPYPVYARAPRAHTVWTAPKHTLRAGARVAATAPAPSSVGRSSAIIAVYQAASPPAVSGTSRSKSSHSGINSVLEFPTRPHLYGNSIMSRNGHFDSTSNS